MSLTNEVAAVRSIVAVIRSLHLSHAQRQEKLTIARRLMAEAIGREYGLGTMDTTGSAGDPIHSGAMALHTLLCLPDHLTHREAKGQLRLFDEVAAWLLEKMGDGAMAAPLPWDAPAQDYGRGDIPF